MLAVLRQRGQLLTSILFAALVALLVIYPIVRLTIAAFDQSQGGLSGAFGKAFDNPATLDSIRGSLLITGLSLLIAVPLGVLLAWITSSTDAYLAKRLAAIPIISLALNPLVAAIGWLVLLEPRVGILNQAVRSVLNLQAEEGPFNAHSLVVMVMIMGLFAVPYVYGPAYGAFVRMDASIEEAGRVTGAGSFRLLWTVILPLIRPAILAGALIAGILLASMFSVPYILETGTGLQVVPTRVYHYINGQGEIGPGTALGALLMVPTVVAMIFYERQLRSARFTTIGGKGGRSMTVRLRRWRAPASALLILFILLGLVIPVVSLIYISLIGFWSADVFGQPLSLANYGYMWKFPHAVEGLWNSTWISAVAGVLALAVGFGVAYLRRSRATVLNRTTSFFASIPLGIPGVVFGIAFLYAFSGPPFPLYQSALLIIIGYWAHILPISLRHSDAAIQQLSPELGEAARITGDSAFGTVRRIVVPLIRTPLLTAWGLTFIILFRDLPISVFIYGATTTPSSVALFSIYNQGALTIAAAYSVVITAISAVIVWVLLARNARVEDAAVG